ncbi:peptide chain release factor N(5)-glutamine methyltransferase [Pedobacter cryotolerans]|uniref:Release factor glutamine methyltransferase n=1 Tax=Pedobacter cryotolerans TaxID=2571270 RepID=A0A4U1C303_9SPHI|nr:peptide chain release factor N(5)-glutamine methyltransferase [Pedobacter cryotolerans]TKB98429.1 peptide chain release factor N(5)-glutamine methyltransferase [Pedobacter cryotolerans]
MQLKQVSQRFIDELNLLYQKDEAQAIFLLTLQHIKQYSRADYILKKEEEISTNELINFENALKDLLAEKPIQYILGETYFYGLPFKVNPSVLIPRPETEELVDWILSVLNSDEQIVNRKSKTVNILDIGTGSGCIAISLKKNLPEAKVYALDIAADTLATAQQNAVLNDVDVNFIQDDILEPRFIQSHISNLTSQISLIVSNPPYVKEDEKPEMNNNVLANEPHRALFVSNQNPLIFYEAIANFALKYLEENGLLFFEINEYLGEQTVQLLKDKNFKNIELKKDMQGKDRMIGCRKIV